MRRPGPDLFAYEPVSTRVRLRTTNMSAAVNYMIAMKDAVVNGNPEASRRAMLAEIGFTNVTPSVFTQLYPRSAADLWLPMSADHDTAFDILSPSPKDANSVLGLLLRNSALRIAANATNEFAGLARGQRRRPGRAERARRRRSRTCRPRPDSATAVASGFTADATETTPAGAGGWTGQGRRRHNLHDQGPACRHHRRCRSKFPADYTRYFDSDALAAFRDALAAIAGIATDRRAVLTGEILDCASHRYDAWVTSLATSRLAGMRALKPGNQIGAWGAVRDVQRRALTAVPASGDVPDGSVTDPQSGGFVMAPSPRQASAAGVLRAAWRAHGGTSRRGARAVRHRPDLDRSASGAHVSPRACATASSSVRSWATCWSAASTTLRGSTALRSTGWSSSCAGSIRSRSTRSTMRAQASAQRLVADGWKLAQAETKTPGAVVAAIPAPTGAAPPTLRHGREGRAASGDRRRRRDARRVRGPGPVRVDVPAGGRELRARRALPPT